MTGIETFLIAALALNVTPGADMTFVMANAIGRGRAAGMAAALGIGFGGLGHALAAALGLTALLALSATAFTVMKYIGAAYLAWMAFQMLRGSGGFDFSESPQPRSLTRTFRDAAIVNLLNPKVALFMLAFLPQFVDPADPDASFHILALGALFCVTGTVVNCLVAWFGSRLGGFIKASRRARRAVQWASAGILGMLAVRIGLLEQS